MGSLESRLVDKILEKLNALPHTRAVKTHGDPFARGGQPDIVGCTYGQMFTLETKNSGKPLRPRQRAELARWAKAGATAERVDSVEVAVDIVRRMTEGL